MNLKFIKWAIPVILEVFNGNGRYPGYFKRNKTIVCLLVTCLACLALALFMFEQALMHGVNSKVHKTSVVELTEHLNQCVKDKEQLAEQCQLK